MTNWTRERVARLLREIVGQLSRAFQNGFVVEGRTLREATDAADALTNDLKWNHVGYGQRADGTLGRIEDIAIPRWALESLVGNGPNVRHPAAILCVMRALGLPETLSDKIDKAGHGDTIYVKCPDPPVERWEYQTIAPLRGLSTKNLNEMGAKGWELVQVDHDDIWIFKRRARD